VISPSVDLSVGLTPRSGRRPVFRASSAAGWDRPSRRDRHVVRRGKYAVLTGSSGIKLLSAPMIQILGPGAAQALPPVRPGSVRSASEPGRLRGDPHEYSLHGSSRAAPGSRRRYRAQVSPRLASRVVSALGQRRIDQLLATGELSADVVFVKPQVGCSDRSEGRSRQRTPMARERPPAGVTSPQCAVTMTDLAMKTRL